MTTAKGLWTLSAVDDLLDLRDRILRAVARRDAERPGSRAWKAAEAEIDSLSRRVWRTVEPRDAERDGRSAAE